MSIRFRIAGLNCLGMLWIVFGSPVAHSHSGGGHVAVAWQQLSPLHGTRDDRQPPVVGSRTISFETSEGTFMNVDVSPDGGTLAFDLLGDIYTLPITGGNAVPLTSGRAWDRAPRFSPDGKSVYFVTDRVGFDNIWRVDRRDGKPMQVTSSDSKIMGTPNWSQDGVRLLAGSRYDKGGSSIEVVLNAIDPDDGSLSPMNAPAGPALEWFTFEYLRPTVATLSGVQAADGEAYFDEAKFDQDLHRRTVRLYAYDPETRSRSAITPLGAPYSEFKPQLSHDGKLLAYFRQYDDRRTEIRILNRTTGRQEAVAKLTNVDDASYGASQSTRPNYAFSVDDRHLIFSHAGKIRRLTLSDGAMEVIPFRLSVSREVWDRARPPVKHLDQAGEAKIIRWPTLSQDGKTMAFAAIGYIWIRDLVNGRTRRLTDSGDFESMPAISYDGRKVVYVSFARDENGTYRCRLMAADIDGGRPRRLLGAANETYLFPKWSHDGSRIALIRESERANETRAAFGWIPASGGTFAAVVEAQGTDSFLGVPLYSFYVGFSDAARSLYFSYPVSKTEMALAAANLDGSNRRTLAVSSPEVGGIVPSPDLKNLILTRRNETVWVIPFEQGATTAKVSSFGEHARRVSDNGGYYADWNGSGQITFGFAQNVYRFGLDRGRLQALQIKVPFSKPVAAQPIAFTGARLITLTGDSGVGNVIESGTIVVNGERILEIGPVEDVRIPDGTLIVDARGKTIIPGLLDTHYHRIGGSDRVWGMSALKLPNAQFSDESAIAYGVTTAWEPGGVGNDGSPAMVDLQRAGRILGPRWSYSAMGTVGSPFEQLVSYGDALAAVQRHKALGVTVLKEAMTPTRQQRQWLSAAAHECGMGIVSHIDNFEAVMTLVMDGYTGGDHSYFPIPYFRDVQELLRRSGYIWTPNIVISGGSIAGSEYVRDYFWQRVTEVRPQEIDKQKELASSFPGGGTPRETPSVPYRIHRVSRVSEQAARAAADGVHVAVSAHNMPGFRLHAEMWYLWRGGLSAEAVLRAATIGNAEKIGLQEEVGSLEPGKIADFLVLDRNPLDDMINTLSLKYTVQGGIVYVSSSARKADLSAMQMTRVH